MQRIIPVSWYCYAYWTTLDNIDIKLEWFTEARGDTFEKTTEPSLMEPPQQNFASNDATIVEANNCFHVRQRVGLVVSRALKILLRGMQVALATTLFAPGGDAKAICRNFMDIDTTVVESDRYFDEQKKKVQANNKLQKLYNSIFNGSGMGTGGGPM